MVVCKTCHAPFALTDTSALSEALREILAGSKSTEDLVPWVIRLQRFADRVDPGSRRHSISTKALVEMILYADMLKSCGTLKKVIREGCRLALPSEVYEGIESYVKSLPLPGKSSVSRFRLSLDAPWMIRHRVLS